jgi:hypothetical protein
LLKNPAFDVQPLKGLLILKNLWHRRSDALIRKRDFSASREADTENKPVIAAVNRCATQNQTQNRVFPQAVRRRSPLPGNRFSEHRSCIQLFAL